MGSSWLHQPRQMSRTPQIATNDSQLFGDRERHCGPLRRNLNGAKPKMSDADVLAVVVVGELKQFPSERAWYFELSTTHKKLVTNRTEPRWSVCIKEVSSLPSLSKRWADACNMLLAKRRGLVGSKAFGLRSQNERRDQNPNNTKKPRLHKVLLDNDNHTTMELVIEVLQKFCHKNRAEATQLMLHVHHKGHFRFQSTFLHYYSF